jgi:hypothetical protein
MIGHLKDIVWLATLAAGLTMSVVWRARLGRRAAPAIAGFAILLAITVVGPLWEPTSVAPASTGLADLLAVIEPTDLAIGVTSSLAYPMGLALLLLAVLRSRPDLEGSPKARP